MPTKLLAWNIQNFTIKKIDPASSQWTVIQTGVTTLRFMNINSLKLNYILDNIINTQPDIFIVIELISGWGAHGSLVTSNGAQGILALLNRLRAINPNWCLVPPLKLTDQIQIGEVDDRNIELLSEGAYTEGIGVFFLKDKLDFIGPYIWPNAPGNDNPDKKGVPDDGTTSGPYPDEWNNCLPDLNYFAGQFEFFTAMGDEIFFPAQKSRRPFLTKFKEKDGKKRILSIASVHYPPNQPDAITAWSRTIGYFLENDVQDKEVVMIVGDFNINYRGPDYVPIDFYKGYYNYHTILNNPAYFPTIYKSYTEATPAVYVKSQGLDNLTFHYGSEDAKDGNPTFGIIDRVVPDAHLGLLSLLYNDMHTILAQPTVDAQNELFRKPFNFGKLGPVPGTSDHLAMLYTI